MLSRWPRHLANELRRAFYLQRRYWFEGLLGLGLLLSLFGGLLYAVLSVSGSALASGEADGLIVGFVLWLFAASAFGSVCQDVQEETEQRSLEQLSLGPLPLWALLSLRALLKLLGGLLMLGLTLWLAEWLAGGRLQISHGPVLAAALLAVPALIGVGYALGGLLLLVKKAELLLVVCYPAVIGLVALPAYPINAQALLPYALGAAAARASAAGAALPASVFGWIALNSLAYLLAGLLIYGVLERRARRLGVLGHF
ncbi:hypothetical protein PEC18_05635 [Paucibacter sp. O1-1]|nr:hypothetical protein [Paucibacter sp. O1-1]MCU7370365.1 hypothetical protein [Paucibacter sp. O1-1]MDA3825328.1 hypothetical protein [Paucibacter sp. O1-1]MDA3825350.1 hypothetical protein [Paucibacter sp. O1-1]